MGRKWNEENRERMAENNRRYRRENAERLAAIKKARRAENRAAESDYGKDYHLKNREARNAKSRAWYHRNKQRVANRHARWAKENSHLRAASSRKRDAAKLRATPAWANLDAIRAIYQRAADLTRETGILHTVDHIVPLQGRNVCGLHHEDNLQILTKGANSAKGNSFPVDGVTVGP